MMQMLNRLTDLIGRNADTNAVTPPAPGLSVDTALDVLTATRRRHVIEYLCTEQQETTVRELSEYLADREEGDRKAAYIALYQQHLPFLRDVGVVVWSQQTSEVKATTLCRKLYALQEDVEAHLH